MHKSLLGLVLLSAAFGFICGNENAQKSLGLQMEKLTGAAIDVFGKQGETDVQPPVETVPPTV